MNIYFIVMIQHSIVPLIDELKQYSFDSGSSLTGFVLLAIPLICKASVIQCLATIMPIKVS